MRVHYNAVMHGQNNANGITQCSFNPKFIRNQETNRSKIKWESSGQQEITG
jgi:hypothetical protein